MEAQCCNVARVRRSGGWRGGWVARAAAHGLHACTVGGWWLVLPVVVQSVVPAAEPK